MLLEDRIRQKDAEALGEFLRERRPQLMAFIERNLGPSLRTKIDADDLFQEVSVECLRALPNVELGDHDPFSWLCQVAERRIVDAHRRFFTAQKRAAGREVPLAGGSSSDQSQRGLIDLIVASITTPSQAFSRGQREFRLLEALDSLGEEAKQAIQMRYVQGLPSKEIAEQLGKSDGAIRVLLTRTLRKLQELLLEE
jgi:RNA polymerase sigma-70 factor (ECF subfamily)